MPDRVSHCFTGMLITPFYVRNYYYRACRSKKLSVWIRSIQYLEFIILSIIKDYINRLCSVKLAKGQALIQQLQPHFNYDSFLFSNISMDLFQINNTPTTNSNTKILAIAALGIASLFIGISIFSSFEEDEDDKQNPQNKQQVRKPAGIYNQGNTCFVNSLLQALASLQSFQDNLEDIIRNFKLNINKNEELLVELAEVIKKINNNSESISVQNLLELINTVKQGLINLQQQDAHELYTAIIGTFEEVVNKQKRLDLSNSIKFNQDSEQIEIENRLIGFTKSSITCTLCKNETAIKIHPFYDLSLQIRPAHVVDIYSALKEFQRQEVIQNWTCTKCTIMRHKRKLKQSIKSLKGENKQKLIFIGEAIIDHLQNCNNFQDDISQINNSLSNFVLSFSKQYQLMNNDPQRDKIFVELQGIQTTILKKTIITKYPKILVIHLKQLIINSYTGEPQLLRKYIGFDESLSIRLKNGEKKYNLTSLLTHIGNQSMGHYFTFRRESRESNNWFVISDSSSKVCKWDYVKSNRAYILFFESD